MTGFRHIPALLLLAVACCLGPAGAAADPNSNVTLLTATLPTMNPGQTAWVSTLWQGACADATSFTLNASGPAGISISYPTNTGSYSSLYKDSTLLAGDIDYAALKITVGDSVVGDQTIALTANYDLAPGGGALNNNGNGNDNGNIGNHYGTSCDKAGGPETQNLQVTLPVVAPTGPVVAQVTTSVGPVAAGTAAWVSVSYKANAPGVTNGRLTVTPPAGATVTYPSDGTSSGFAGDSDLAVGATDYASFRIDTGGLKPGTYTLGVDLSYGNGAHLPGSVTLVVN